jgi:hypothetical protein
LDKQEYQVINAKTQTGQSISIFGDINDRSSRNNIWIIFHEDESDRLSFISKEGLNISIRNDGNEYLYLSVHFEEEFGDVRFDENRTPIVQVDFHTLVDSREWALSEHGNLYSTRIDKKVFEEEIGEGYEIKIRIFTALIDQFEGVQTDFSVHDFSFPFNNAKPLFQVFFPKVEFVDLNTGEILN